MPPEFSSRISTAPDVMIRIIGDEAVILNLKSELYLGLDPIGTRFWTALHDAPSIQAAYELLLAESMFRPIGFAMTWESFLINCLNNN
jgi:hypothetical protein